MSDGGVDDVQLIINALVGGSYTTLKVTNFKFQNDPKEFINTEAKDRKAVIGELAGLEPITKAWKILDKRRLESARAHQDKEQQLAGMLAVGKDQEQRVAAL